MRFRQFASPLLALLLMAALAVSVSAVPGDEAGTTAETETLDSVTTTAPEEGETQEQATIAIMPYQSLEETTVGIVPVNDDILFAQPEAEGLLSQRNISFAALVLSGFAVLLSVIALARTRKKAAPNAAGNYQKYF
ncbi:MAG: hypothetical protein LBB75_08740 [Oscillospiraceae bacterium]|nr:hypothetical protein [Oscillospiraceae bacterium]